MPTMTIKTAATGMLNRLGSLPRLPTRLGLADLDLGVAACASSWLF